MTRASSTFVSVLLLLLAAAAAAHNEGWPPPGRVPTPTGEPGRPLRSGETPTPGGPEPPRRNTGGASGAEATEPRPWAGLDWRLWWWLNRDRLTGQDAVRARRRAARTPDLERRARIVKALLDAARGADPDLSTSAIVALGRSGATAAVPVLRARAIDPKADATIRESAALALGLIGPPAEEAGGEPRGLLTGLLRDRGRPGRERGFAALGLALLGDPAAVPALLGLVGEGEEPLDLRCVAAFAAGRIGGRIAEEDLRRLLGDDDDPPLLRAHAAAGLSTSGSGASRKALVGALGDRSPDVRRQAALSLSGVEVAEGVEAVPALVSALAADPDLRVRAYAAVALGEIGAAAGRAPLVRAYRFGDRRVAPWAAIALGLFARVTGDVAAAEKTRGLLRRQLSELPPSDLTAALALAAALAGDGKAGPRLREMFGARSAPRVRADFAVALGILGVAEAGTALRATLEAAKDPVLIGETAYALGLLADGGAAEILLGMIGASDLAFVRCAAASAMGRMAAPGTAAALLALLEDPEAPLAARAFAAVGLGLGLEGRPRLAGLGARLCPTVAAGALAEALTFF